LSQERVVTLIYRKAFPLTNKAKTKLLTANDGMGVSPLAHAVAGGALHSHEIGASKHTLPSLGNNSAANLMSLSGDGGDTTNGVVGDLLSPEKEVDNSAGPVGVKGGVSTDTNRLPSLHK
jgi:hypothetical protein